ncbi:MAG: hypothetical protein R3D58_13870 [Saprospiraceae bacterium]
MKKIATLILFVFLSHFQLAAQCDPDTEPPVVVAANDLCINFLPSKNITIYAADLVLASSDNCTAKNELVYAIRKLGTGTGFPTDTAGNPQTQITFHCINYGLQLLEVWARDEAGNAGWDSSLIVLIDKFDFCHIDPVWGNGCAKTESNELLAEITWNFDLEPPVDFHPCLPQPPYTGPCLQQMFIGKTSTTVRPSLDKDPLNGVSTFDLVLINKHILGIEPLNSPYKILAADANNSKSVSISDVVELRKLLLGIYTELPLRDSWGFVLKSFQFPDPANPFATPVPNTLAYVYHQNQNQNFIGYKVGDVNGNAVANAQAPAEERLVATLRLDDRVLLPGQTTQIPLHLSEARKLLGLQFALAFDLATLEISNITFSDRLTSSQPITEGQFYAQPQPGLLTLSWDDPTAPALPAGAPLLFLEIKARQALQLSQALRLKTERLRPELYTADGTIHRLALDFSAAPKIGQTRIFPAAKPGNRAGGYPRGIG